MTRWICLGAVMLSIGCGGDDGSGEGAEGGAAGVGGSLASGGGSGSGGGGVSGTGGGAGEGSGGGAGEGSGGTAGEGSGGAAGASGSGGSGGTGGSAGTGGSGGGVLGCPHVPAGYVNVVNRKFETKAKSDSDRGTGSFPDKVGGSEGWDGVEWNKGNLSVMSDASNAPVSSPSYMRWTYPQGMQAGVSPGTSQTQGFKTSGAHGYQNYKSLYFCYAFRPSANYYANPTVGNKMIFLQAIGDNGAKGGMNNILFLKGAGTGNLSLQVNAQGSGDAGAIKYNGQTMSWLPANVSGAATTGVNAVARGAWHVVEAEVSLGNKSQSNGFWRIWYDGVLTHEYLNIELHNNALSAQVYFNVFQISPTYGGGGSPVPYTFTLDIDHVAIWASPT